MTTNTERVDSILRASGIPIDGVALINPPSGFRVDYKPEATPPQIALGSSIISNLDFSESALSAWNNQDKKEIAKLALDDTTPVITALRITDRVEYLLIREALQAINQIRSYLMGPVAVGGAGSGQMPNVLTTRTWPQLQAYIRSQIDAE